MRRAVLWVALLTGCSTSTDPYCSNIVDLTGAPVILCPTPRLVPVCDDPGAMARFELGTRGWELIDGTPARCTSMSTIDCASGEPARCIEDPER
jgi:hypothetical protein